MSNSNVQLRVMVCSQHTAYSQRIGENLQRAGLTPIFANNEDAAADRLVRDALSVQSGRTFRYLAFVALEAPYEISPQTPGAEQTPPTRSLRAALPPELIFAAPSSLGIDLNRTAFGDLPIVQYDINDVIGGNGSEHDNSLGLAGKILDAAGRITASHPAAAQVNAAGQPPFSDPLTPTRFVD